MKNTTWTLSLILLVGALAIAGCNSSGTDGPEPGTEGEAATEGSAAEGSAAEGEAAEGEAAEDEAAEGSAAEGSAAAGGEAAAAGPITAESLHGAWEADFQAMLADPEMSEEERAMAQAVLGSATMILTFGADGSLTMTGMTMGEEMKQAGTCEVLSIDGSTATLSTSMTREGGELDTETMTVVFDGAAAMTMSDEGGRPVPFKRQG